MRQVRSSALPAPAGRRNKISKNVPQIILNAVIILLLFLMIFPLAMSVWNAFKLDYQFEDTMWYPTFPLNIYNLFDAFAQLKEYILNTVVVGIAGGGGLLLVAGLSAYAFARIDFPGRRFFFSMVIALLMMPGVLTLIPTIQLYKDFGLLNNRFSLILPLWTTGPIFGVFLLTSFFKGIPKDIFESAKLDGATDLHCFVKIALPLCMPIMGTLTIMTLVNIWNDYLWPMTVLENVEYMTISAGLVLTYTKEHSANMPLQFAGYLVASAPLILLFVAANKYYIEGLVGASIKM